MVAEKAEEVVETVDLVGGAVADVDVAVAVGELGAAAVPAVVAERILEEPFASFAPAEIAAEHAELVHAVADVAEDV